MDITIYPRKLCGTVTAIPSKSQAHRLLICAAFSDKNTTLHCPQTNQDIEATADCLRALGAQIDRTANGYYVAPISGCPKSAVLNCKESGSTLRFMLPIVGALGVDTVFEMAGRLPSRPLTPLWEEMERMGCTLSRPTENTLRCCGKLSAGNYEIAGNVSSQFISGLLFATALMSGQSSITITGKIESKPYIDITQHALAIFGVTTDNYHVTGSALFQSPGEIAVEGDWSNAAFFLAAKTLGSEVEVNGLNTTSAQGDRIADQLLNSMTQPIKIDAANIPDLVPILAIAASYKHGATFTNVSRLRLKESDRIASVMETLHSLGVQTIASENELTVIPGNYHGCTINAFGDHRIAMSAAIAATVADGPVTILGAQCVEKSYPSFWEVYKQLGGHYEQHIR